MWPDSLQNCSSQPREIARKEGVNGAAVYGAPPPDVIVSPSSALRISPVVPCALDFDSVATASLSRIDVQAPANTLERGYVLAQAVRRLKPGGQLNAAARKDRGGLRLRRELEGLGLKPREEVRRGHRICRCVVGPQVNQAALTAAIVAGELRYVPGLSLWSQPGLFSWNRLRPGHVATD